MIGSPHTEQPLLLADDLAEKLKVWARAGYPEESCGLLVGTHTAHATVVQQALRVANVSLERRNDRYVLDPEGFLRADAEARARGLDIVGLWHTHPDHPARPSRTDLDAAWEGYSYVIVSVDALGATEIGAWRLHAETFHEQPIEIALEAEPWTK